MAVIRNTDKGSFKGLTDTPSTYSGQAGNFVKVSSGENALEFAASVSSANAILTNVACDATVYAGAAVRLESGTAYNALADSLTNSNIIGIVDSKVSATICNIRLSGTTDGNQFTGLDETKEYYLSATIAGAITDVPPSATGNILLRVGQPFDSQNMVVIKGTRTVRL